MKTSNDVKNIIAALLKAQTKISNAKKDGTNTYFNGSKYATLESVIEASKEALSENNLLLTQTLTTDQILITTIYHESGEFMQSELKLMLNKQDMQQLGSAITYARRYSITSILNIAQEDDDGNGASQPPPNNFDRKIQPNPILEKQQLLEKPEDYVITFGTKFKGKKLSEVSIEEIDKNIDYWEAQEKKAPVSHMIHAFLTNARQHLINKGFYPPKQEETGEIK